MELASEQGALSVKTSPKFLTRNRSIMLPFRSSGPTTPNVLNDIKETPI